MKLTYDPRHNIAYLAFRDGPVEVETVEVSGLVNVDLAPDGGIYGIELLNANEQLLGGAEARRVVIVNEADGATSEAVIPG
jgi:uncharacterized protein YuzE